jgi:leucyl-tRNA synthetase
MDLDTTPTDQQAVRELQRLKHRTIKRAVNDLEKFKFNTMLAALMEFTNEMQDIWENKQVDAVNWHDAIRSFLLILAPVAPHVAEELWEHTGGSYSIHNQRLPDWDEELARAEEFELVVQINGKLKDKIVVPADVPEETAKRLALESDRVKTFLHGKCVARIIYVPGRLVNVVVS